MGAHYTFSKGLAWVLAKTCFAFKVVHRERIIEQGGVLIAMNHESYLDPPLAGIACRREIHYLARKTLLRWPVLGPMFPKLNVIPVDQERADMSAIKTVIRLIKKGECTIVFPEGARTPDGQLQPAQAGLGLIVAKTRCPIVPMRIFGAHRAFPRGGRPASSPPSPSSSASHSILATKTSSAKAAPSTSASANKPCPASPRSLLSGKGTSFPRIARAGGLIAGRMASENVSMKPTAVLKIDRAAGSGSFEGRKAQGAGRVTRMAFSIPEPRPRRWRRLVAPRRSR